MIRYSLRCEAGHGFDGWFRSSADFDAQAARSLLGCPVCGSHAVEKALMAPAISTGAARAAVVEAGTSSGGDQGASAPSAPPGEQPSEALALAGEGQSKLRAMLRELKEHVTKTSEDVGERFPDLARQMHAQEIEHRSIRGRATAEEAKALAEEGVEVHPLPVFPDDLN